MTSERIQHQQFSNSHNELLPEVRSKYLLDDLATDASCRVCEGCLTPVLTQYTSEHVGVSIPVEDVPAHRCFSEECNGALTIPPQVGVDIDQRIVRQLQAHSYSALAEKLMPPLLYRKRHIAPSAQRLLKRS